MRTGQKVVKEGFINVGALPRIQDLMRWQESWEVAQTCYTRWPVETEEKMANSNWGKMAECHGRLWKWYQGLLLSLITGKLWRFIPASSSLSCVLRPSLDCTATGQFSFVSNPAFYLSKGYDSKCIPGINLYTNHHLIVCSLELNLKLCLRGLRYV